MTNREAIELLKRATLFEPTLENRDYPEALDLAIKALEQIDLIKFNIHALNKLIEEAENEP